MTKPIIGILGAGKLGTVLAKIAINSGYEVLIAGSGSVEKIALTIEVLVPGAKAKVAAEVAEKADIIILALPLGKYKSVPKEKLANKIVIDAMNYWWEVDGPDNDILKEILSSSEVVAKYLKNSIVVKAFNHMGYHDLEEVIYQEDGQERKAIAYATDDLKASNQVAKLIENIGFDSLNLGELSRGVILEPGYPPFGANLSKIDLQKMIETINKD
ncbi:NADPH-dependent F420 reductase [Vagococcus fluvialis]|uniref:NADPH-dependent F420 reductase n=1 Tax=Vagococcus fluvialis TaxID=2738 RepID=UPI001A8ECE0F|nr:NAD(P)-binding domain-containing protein [Vagococcus fluvialis]MBO0436375.1 NAD(P)-binding domain-containing protein [Vagococcus fluvialis]